MPFIGLTGGYGTGKTTVLKFFRSMGSYTVNADSIVHNLLRSPAIIKRLAALLGKNILTKRAQRVVINRKRMAEIIFNDPDKRMAVEKLLHPEVIKEASNMLKQIMAKDKRAVIVFEVPLMFEGGYQDIFDKTIMVYCTAKTAIKRLMMTGLSEEEIKQRMKAQMPSSKKKAMADYVINNNAGIVKTKAQVKNIFLKLTSMKKE
jgi:dephospho-CoA kinase